MIEYKIGDATRPVGDGRKVIAHVVNDRGAWGAGFVLALSGRWPAAESYYRRWARRDYRHHSTFKLGAIQLVPVATNIYVANLLAQHGIGGPCPLRYDALRTCLMTLAEECQKLGASVHMPRIGCGLGGGTWERVEPILHETLVAAGVPVTVYDLPERTPTHEVGGEG